MLYDAAPLSNGTCASTFEPSWNVTIPVGSVEPPATSAVKVTVSPEVDGFGDEVNVVVVAKAWTFWTSVALAPGKSASPL